MAATSVTEQEVIKQRSAEKKLETEPGKNFYYYIL